MPERGCPAVVRIWRGRTTRERADADRACNHAAGIEPLIAKALGVQTFREDWENETAFVTVSYRESVEAMAAVTGGDPTDIRHLERDAAFPIELPRSVQVPRRRHGHGDGGASR